MFKNKLRSIIASSLLINSFIIPIKAMEKSAYSKSKNEILCERIDGALETICLLQLNHFKPIDKSNLDIEKKKYCLQCGNELVRTMDYNRNRTVYYCEGEKNWTVADAQEEDIESSYLQHKERINFDFDFFCKLVEDQYKEGYKQLLVNEQSKSTIDFLSSFLNLAKSGTMENKIEKLNVKLLQENFNTLFAYFQILVKKFYDDRCKELEKCISEIAKEKRVLNYVDSDIPKGKKNITKISKYFQVGYNTRHELLARNIFIMRALVEYVFGKDSNNYKILEQYELLYSQEFFKLVESCLKHFEWNHDFDNLCWSPEYGYGQWGKPQRPGSVIMHALSYLKEEEYKMKKQEFEERLKKVANNTKFYDIGIKLSETAPKGPRGVHIWLTWAKREYDQMIDNFFKGKIESLPFKIKIET